jgi:hypothetical protein
LCFCSEDGGIRHLLCVGTYLQNCIPEGCYLNRYWHENCKLYPHVFSYFLSEYFTFYIVGLIDFHAICFHSH